MDVTAGSQNKIALLHFLPLELYPPVMNFINVWAASVQDNKEQLTVYSTPGKKETASYTAPSSQVIIRRTGDGKGNKSRMQRMIDYLRYHFQVSVWLIRTRPATVFYIDSLSSFPAWLYKNFFNRQCRLFIHYHEYMSPKEYATGMTLLKFFHRLEKGLYGKVNWISQTNQERLRLFAADHPGLQKDQLHLLPNYPPASWQAKTGEAIQRPVRFVQVGVLSLDTMFTREFANWIVTQEGKATWHVYAQMLDQAAFDYLHSLHTPYIQYRGAVPYHDLPKVLTNYDVGIILYRGHIPNYVYNAPNKLFEYYRCGLDVWLPIQMITAANYQTSGTYPQIKAIDFEKIGGSKLDELVDRKDLRPDFGNNYTAEHALKDLLVDLREELRA